MASDLLRRARAAGELDERRVIVCPVALRKTTRATDDEPAAAPVLEGYGALFNNWAQIGPDAWGFMESISPGAFRQSIGEDDIRSFFNHDECFVLGRNTTKTLELAEDDKGLKVVIHPPDTSCARDVVMLIERGDVSGMSFMFRVRKETWEEPQGKGELPKRTLQDIQLIEVGPVSLPAYPETSIAARDHATALREARTVAAQAVVLADGDRVRRMRLAQAWR